MKRGREGLDGHRYPNKSRCVEDIDDGNGSLEESALDSTSTGRTGEVHAEVINNATNLELSKTNLDGSKEEERRQTFQAAKGEQLQGTTEAVAAVAAVDKKKEEDSIIFPPSSSEPTKQIVDYDYDIVGITEPKHKKARAASVFKASGAHAVAACAVQGATARSTTKAKKHGGGTKGVASSLSAAAASSSSPLQFTSAPVLSRSNVVHVKSSHGTTLSGKRVELSLGLGSKHEAEIQALLTPSPVTEEDVRDRLAAKQRKDGDSLSTTSSDLKNHQANPSSYHNPMIGKKQEQQGSSSQSSSGIHEAAGTWARSASSFNRVRDYICGGTNTDSSKPSATADGTETVPGNLHHPQYNPRQDSFDALSVSKKDTEGADVGLYDDALLQYYSNNIVFMDKTFRVVAVFGITLWLTLIYFVYRMAPEDSYQDLNEIEFYSTILAAVLIFVSAATKCIRLVLRRGWSALFSGIMTGALAVQFIAMSTDALMALVKVPILLDPVTRARVYLFRYCEWTPLAFMMTFYTEGVNIPEDVPKDLNGDGGGAVAAVHHDDGDSTSLTRRMSLRFFSNCQKWKRRWRWSWRLLQAPVLHASSQGISAFMGWVFPFCPDFFWWMVMMVISCVTYVVLFPRLWYKRRVFQKMSRGTSVDEIEVFDRARLSYRLLITCAVMWSVLVSMYYFQSFAHWFVEDGSILKNKSLPFVCEAIIDVMAKAMYMDIIVDVHDCVFDDGARSARRLEELRRMMSVVWECSSDVIALSVRGRTGTVTTMLSPTFLKLQGFQEKDTPMGLKAIIFEQPSSEFTQGLHKMKFFSDYTCIDILDGRRIYVNDPKFHKATQQGLWSMRKLMVNAWNGTTGSEALMIHDIQLLNGKNVQCEGKLTRLEANALVIVTRDISERYRRFEAEKRAVSELTARRKDAEANRFTRHEVKNGLLASIALCDTLKDTLCKEKLNKLTMAEKNMSARTVAELDTTLREVLDTVLAEAMARDVVHEIYEPRMERVDLRKILTCSPAFGHKSMQRFPLVTFPSPLPIFIFDPQLLRYIHRNAVSNACKYGKKGGVVLTEVHYKKAMGELELNVINLPGDNHARLMALGGAAQEAVFAPGKRLHTGKLDPNSGLTFPAGHNNDHASHHSSGDGAWISRKCAKTLGGDCSIKFETKRTIFTLRCPATPFQFMHHGKAQPRTSLSNFSMSLKGAGSQSLLDGGLRGGNRGAGSATTYNNTQPIMPVGAGGTMLHSSNYPFIPFGGLEDPSTFRLPPNTIGVTIDDSKIQRKLMRKLFSLVGIPVDRQIVLGFNAEEIRGFSNHMIEIIQENQSSRILLIADENLDVMEDATHHQTISGSMCIERLRKRLSPQDERRLLALVRSANDGQADLAVYKARAHGFFPKAPIKRNDVVEILAPLWEARFPGSLQEGMGAARSNPTSSADLVAMKSSGMIQHGSQQSNLQGMGNASWPSTVPVSGEAQQMMGSAMGGGYVNPTTGASIIGLHGEDGPVHGLPPASSGEENVDMMEFVSSTSDLMQTLDLIDGLCKSQSKELGMDVVLPTRWPVIWEKLIALKGDLKTFRNNEVFDNVLISIDELKSPTLPPDFAQKWNVIRNIIVDIIQP